MKVPDDGMFMRRALDLARNGWGQTAPNPMVGAVVVRDGTTVGEGWHERFGEAHAEVNALRAAGDRAEGATLYVTLEPCAHTGHTAPCTDAILAAGIARVVLASMDPNPIAAGGAACLREAGVVVDVGVDERAARELNAPFFHRFASDRPFVQLKLAMSLDGAIADHTRTPAWLTGAESRREGHRLRAGVDAMAVGIGTALADDPLLTVRDVEPPPRIPLTRIVFDTSARLPLDSQLVLTARLQPVLVVCWAPDPAHAAALEHAGVTLLHAGTLSDALRALRDLGMGNLLIEGGASLAASFLQDALVDRLIIFRSPLILGGGSLNGFAAMPAITVREAPRWRICETRRVGDDEMTVYAPPL